MRALLLRFGVGIVIIALAMPPTASAEQGKAPELPASVDLRPDLKRWELEPRSQGKRNTCSVFVTTAALEFALSKQRNEGVSLSPEYLNWACNQVIKNRTDDRGQFFHDLLRGFQLYGICYEKDMPYQEKFYPQFNPPAQALRNAKAIHTRALRELRLYWINPWKPEPGLTDYQVMEIKSVLAKGWPVAAGSSHSCLLVGYQDAPQKPGGGVFIANDSGSGKYTEVTYEFVKTKVGDVFWVEAIPRTIPKK